MTEGEDAERVRMTWKIISEETHQKYKKQNNIGWVWRRELGGKGREHNCLYPPKWHYTIRWGKSWVGGGPPYGIKIIPPI